MTNLPTYSPGISTSAQRLIADAKVFPTVYILGEDGSLTPKVFDVFIRDIMEDPSTFGWDCELRGSPPELIVKILRLSDVLKTPGE